MALRAGERVQERRLADVRVAGERDRRRLRARRATCAASRAAGSRRCSRRSQQRDPAPRQPPVGLELRLAGAARADAAAEPLEVLPHAAHARQVVLELRELDLELALGAAGVLGEDVEDQLRAVDDARLERVLERAAAGVGSSSSSTSSDSASSPRTRASAPRACLCRHRCAGSGRGRRWTISATGLDAGRPRKLAELAQLLVGIDVRAQHGDDESPLRIRTGSRVGLALSHDRIMTSALVIRSTASSRRESGTVSESLK